MMRLNNPIKVLAWLFLTLCSGAAVFAIGIYLYLAPTLPEPAELRDVDLQTPLRVYTVDGKLITEFGEKRRTPLTFEQIPPRFIDALLASEDDGFYQHYGIDVKGLLRASLELIRTGRKKSGGSTITMQVAKNYFLSSEKSFTRKFTEILLALKIEQTLTKQEILELYINKIYLGKRAYGIEAAAQVYYGKSIQELTLAQTAMIAGLPQAPSAANPINNPQRAFERRNYVLARMLELGKITQAEYAEASKAPVTASYHATPSEAPAPYIAEMVRQKMVAQYGEEAAYTRGYRVFTSIDSTRQQAANDALQRGVLDYDRSHGYRQKPHLVELATGTEQPEQEWLQANQGELPINWAATQPNWRKALQETPDDGVIEAAIVSRIMPKGAWIYTSHETFEFLPFVGMEWAAPYIDINTTGRKPSRPADILSRGQKIWIERRDNKLLLAQVPDAESALVSIDPRTGAIQALVGGFSQADNQFNRVIQAQRQPGSSFKPFVYSAALANGFTPATIINDAPVVFEDVSLESSWRPENYNGKFNGPTRLRQALYRSQNLVSIRILKQITPRVAVDYIVPFGFKDANLHAELSLALGSSAVTPLQLATGYSVLANGGYAVQPWFIDRIEDADGNVLEQTSYPTICEQCDQDNPEEMATHAPRVMDARTNFLMVSMLRDVIRRGTGTRAKELGRDDLAGKTGTTNDQKDAWFSGFNSDLVTTVWVGFDTPTTLGKWAFGGSTALPIWIDYMRVALHGIPERYREQPDGIVSVKIDPETGLLASPGQGNAIFEFFREEDVPQETAQSSSLSNESTGSSPELLF